MTDFEFDGEYLSEYNCILGNITSEGETTHSLGSEMGLNTVKNNDVDHIISINYPTVLTKTFEVIKNNCFDMNDSEFTDVELQRIMRWLNKRGYKKFRPIYDDDNFIDVFFYGTFTKIGAITVLGKVIGLSLTFTSNSPYGYGDNTPELRVVDANKSIMEIYNNSQEHGYLYFNKFIITCEDDGDIIFKNTSDPNGEDNVTIIENCVSGEIITIDCINRIITSSEEHSTLYNDFNYNYPRLYQKEINEMENIFEFDTDKMSSLNVQYLFYPIRKVGVIV